MKGGLREQGERKFSTHEQPLVSVITVVFNGEKYLEQTIQSVLQQTYSNFEYIIIDGGSTDRTLDIIRKYENKIDYWLSEVDRGIADGFNKGIEAACGEIIGIINADDWYEPYAIATAQQLLGKNDIIYGNLRLWNEHKLDRIVTANHKRLKREMTIQHPATFVRNTAYQRWGNFNLTYRNTMDYDLMLRFFLKGAQFVYVDSVLANMRRGGISQSGWHKALKEVYDIKKSYGVPLIHILFYNNLLSARIRLSRFVEALGLRHAFIRFESSITKFTMSKN
jgi:glycosyltransferase involved in cell wall biosynthesis